MQILGILPTHPFNVFSETIYCLKIFIVPPLHTMQFLDNSLMKTVSMEISKTLPQWDDIFYYYSISGKYKLTITQLNFTYSCIFNHWYYKVYYYFVLTTLSIYYNLNNIIYKYIITCFGIIQVHAIVHLL